MIDPELEVDEDNPQEISAYVETWFDVDKKFDIRTREEKGTWMNMFCRYNPFADTVRIMCVISRDGSCEYLDYEPTAEEARLLKDMIAEKLMAVHGRTPRAFCEGVYEEEQTMGGIS